MADTFGREAIAGRAPHDPPVMRSLALGAGLLRPVLVAEIKPQDLFRRVFLFRCRLDQFHKRCKFRVFLDS